MVNGDEPLCVSFFFLFAIASSKEKWVMDLWNQSNERGCWTPSFSRHLNDWEIEIVGHFFSRLQEKAVIRRETLLGWHDSFVGRKRKKAWGATPLYLFWIIWKERNKRLFENKELSDQKLKCCFFVTCVFDQVVYNWRSNVLIWFHWLVRLFLREWVVFCCPFYFSFSIFFLSFLAIIVYVLYALVCSFWWFLFNTIFIYLSKMIPLQKGELETLHILRRGWWWWWWWFSAQWS